MAQEPQNGGYVKLWRTALDNGSSLMELTSTQRWVFLAYVAAARWKDPYRGSLCDEDGTPWSRTERAEIAGVGYKTAKLAEEAMVEHEMAVIDGRASTGHHNSQGRFRIANYDDYQAADASPKRGPSLEIEGSTSEIEGNYPSECESTSEIEGNQPSKSKDGSFDDPSSEIEGSDASSPEGSGDESEPISDNSSLEIEGSTSQEGSKKNYNDNDPPTKPSPKDDENASIADDPDGNDRVDGQKRLSFKDLENIWNKEIADLYRAIDLRPLKHDSEKEETDFKKLRRQFDDCVHAVFPEANQQLADSYWTELKNRIENGISVDTVFEALNKTLRKALTEGNDFSNLPSSWMNAVIESGQKRRSQANEADPTLKHFIRFYGPNPQESIAHKKQEQWESYRKKFRKNPLYFFMTREHLQEKGAAIGFWPEPGSEKENEAIRIALDWSRKRHEAQLDEDGIYRGVGG